MNEMSKTREGRSRIAAAAERLDFIVSELGQQPGADVPEGKTTRGVEQHQPEQGLPTFLPMIESEIVRPTPEKTRAFVEAPSHHADKPGQRKNHEPQ